MNVDPSHTAPAPSAPQAQAYRDHKYLARSWRLGALLWVCLCLWTSNPGYAAIHAAPGFQLAGAARELLDASTRFAARSGLKLAAKEAAEESLQVTAKRLAPRLVEEGGELLVKRVVALTDELGPTWLTALESSTAPRAVIEAVEALPLTGRPAALSALLREGPTIGKAIAKVGGEALEAEIKHPGIGAEFVAAVGDDGARLARQLDSADLAILARYQEPLGALPAASRSSLVEALGKNGKAVCEYLRRNPGFALSAATVGVLLLESDRAVEIAGQVAQTVAGSAGSAVSRLMDWVAPVLSLGLAAWIVLKLLRGHRRTAGRGGP